MQPKINEMFSKNAEGEVCCEIFYCPLPPAILAGEDSAASDLILNTLPDYRREKADKFRYLKDMVRSAAAWQLLRFAVRKLCGAEANDISVLVDEKGKPSFADVDFAGLHFNLSHCKTAVACALSPTPVGVDIEVIRTCNLAAAKRIMPSAVDNLSALLTEGECGHSGGQPTLLWTRADEEFTKDWTRAESALKCGFSGSDNLIQSFRVEDLFISTCTQSPVQQPQLAELSSLLDFIKTNAKHN